MHEQLGHGVDTRVTHNLGSDVLLHALLHSQADPPVLQGVVLPHVEVVVVLLLALLQEDHGKSIDFVKQTLFQLQDWGFWVYFY